ncbi:MAG: ABC transporter permease [Chloroflexi bacterium]|uniref:Transport permease protein n=1 Tax=Candidatus Chlorohelix allophototropha TaxID=3003348 RepID=A0A8T7M1B2_9CHLR|nr:ABC transporter permease [Chloroflexota bacterium]WJW66347.1 ABC transporter permease [Chloroflexota bacterium L227-S17]
MTRFFSNFWDLFLIQLANWRWSWAATMINGLLVPLTTFFFFKLLATSGNTEQDLYLLSGNIIVSLLFTTMYGTCARFSFMRTFGVLDYYATLPVYKGLLVLAVNAGFLVLTLPTALLTVLMGQYIFNITISLSPLFLLIVPLASFSLSAVGALVGVTAPNFDTATSISGVLQFIFMGLSPILVAADRLPEFVQWIGKALPSTYAAEALRLSLIGQFNEKFWLDVVILLVVNTLIMLYVGSKMEWRSA